MIKLVFCLRKKPGLDSEEFHRYWRDEHAPLVQRHAAVLRIRRYVQSVPMVNPGLLTGLAGRGDGQAYDGVAELWWDSVEDALSAPTTEEGRGAARALYRDEKRFIDLANSRIFYTTENIVMGGDRLVPD